MSKVRVLVGTRKGAFILTSDGKPKIMRLAKCLAVIFACISSSGVLPSVAAAQVPAVKDLPKIFDASMPRDRQIALALSAAPAELSSKATLYVLGPKGYEKAREGTNGVNCFVARSFVSPAETTIEPMCFDPEGSRTLMLVRMHMEDLRAEGKSEAEIKADVANGYKDGRLHAPSKPGVLYMLSTDNRLGPTRTGGTASFPPHLMFYAPYMTVKDLGYDAVSGNMVPFLSKPGEPDALMVVVPAQ